MSTHLVAAILWAIAQVETPAGVPLAPGPAGESGRWQLTRAVRMDRAKDLKAVGAAVNDEALARAHLLWLEREFRKIGVKPSPFQLALAWNAGFGAALRGEVQPRHYDFAWRVSNLVEERR